METNLSRREIFTRIDRVIKDISVSAAVEFSQAPISRKQSLTTGAALATGLIVAEQLLVPTVVAAAPSPIVTEIPDSLKKVRGWEAKYQARADWYKRDLENWQRFRSSAFWCPLDSDNPAGLITSYEAATYADAVEYLYHGVEGFSRHTIFKTEDDAIRKGNFASDLGNCDIQARMEPHEEGPSEIFREISTERGTIIVPYEAQHGLLINDWFAAKSQNAHPKEGDKPGVIYTHLDAIAKLHAQSKDPYAIFNLPIGQTGRWFRRAKQVIKTGDQSYQVTVTNFGKPDITVSISPENPQIKSVQYSLSPLFGPTAIREWKYGENDIHLQPKSYLDGHRPNIISHIVYKTKYPTA